MSTNEPARGRHASTRRRGDVLLQAIFDAVFEELRRGGYEKLTMDRVAAAAGTGKAALYRRWPSKVELVADALRSALPSPADVPAQDHVRDDILALLRCIVTAFAATHGTAFQAVKAEAGPDAGLIHGLVQERVVGPCEQLLLEALRRGAERREVRPEAVTTRVARVGPAMLIHHTLTERSEMSDEHLASIVDDVVMPLIRA